MNRFCSALAACVLIACVSPASASTVTFTLANVNFEGGGDATGSFTVDLATNAVIASDLLTSPGSTYAYAFRYSTEVQSLTQAYQFRADISGPIGVIFLVLNFDAPLDPVALAGGTPVPLSSGVEELLSIVVCPDTAGFCGARFIVEGGSLEVTAFTPDVAPTPLPAALPLFAGGLGVIGFAAHRRRKTKAQRAA